MENALARDTWRRDSGAAFEITIKLCGTVTLNVSTELIHRWLGNLTCPSTHPG